MVAVKIIDKTKLNQESLQQQSLEVHLLSRLSEHEHPNIVKLYQVINTKTKLYLVMEYCGRDVCDLYDYIQKHFGGSKLDEDEAKHIFRQICSAISYCHSMKIVHRDLKPENLLIITEPTIDGSIGGTYNQVRFPVVKLIDFGFAKQWDDGVKLRTSCGSLAYSAPEILLGDQYDGDKVDIWGLGCILYILLYGCNPFMQINDNETLIRILDCSFITPHKPYVSHEGKALIRGLLRKEPTSRLSVKQVLTDSWFRDLTSVVTSTVSASQQPTSPPPSLDQQDVSTDTVDGKIKETKDPTISPLRGESVKKSPPLVLPLRSKSPNSVNEVHERVIQEMISQQMVSSKERVERALRISRSSPIHAPTTALPTVTESEPLPSSSQVDQLKPDDQGDEDTPSCPSTSTPSIAAASSSADSFGNDSYITATYNLLKDKMMRELTGGTSLTIHDIRTSHKKGGGILSARIRKPCVSQAPRFSRPNVVLQDLKSKCMEEEEEDEESSNGNHHKDSLDELPVQLPLQRKCSIVSEEGSCELSGRLSDTGSELHTFIFGDDKEVVVKKGMSVDIVITDTNTGIEVDGFDPTIVRASTPDPVLEEEVSVETIEDIDEEDECDAPSNLGGDVNPAPKAEMEDDIIDGDNISITIIPHGHQTSICPSQRKGSVQLDPNKNLSLHTTSSSPDLSREHEDDKLDFEPLPTITLCTITSSHTTEGVMGSTDAGSNPKRRTSIQRPVTMFVDEGVDEVIDDVGDHIQSKKAVKINGFLSSDPPSCSGASVRIITQSKSCNNILCNEPHPEGESCERRGSKNQSSKGPLSKGRKMNRTDCCTLC